MAFDLGLNKDSTEAEVDALIAMLDTWTLVMLTEYMDHSLVLLKRKMCWSLEDVAYYVCFWCFGWFCFVIVIFSREAACWMDCMLVMGILLGLLEPFRRTLPTGTGNESLAREKTNNSRQC